MQWVHSLKGLVGHLRDWADDKLREVDTQEAQVAREKAERAEGAEADGAEPHRTLLDGSGPIDHRKLAAVVRCVRWELGIVFFGCPCQARSRQMYSPFHLPPKFH